jgi:hypothetical protein
VIIRVKLPTVVTRRVGPDLVSGRELPMWPPTRARPDARSGPTKSAGRVPSVNNMFIGVYTKKYALWDTSTLTLKQHIILMLCDWQDCRA